MELGTTELRQANPESAVKVTYSRIHECLNIALLLVAIAAVVLVGLDLHTFLGKGAQLQADADDLIKQSGAAVSQASRGMVAVQSQALATLTDVRRTVLIAGGVLNVTRQIERDNRDEIHQVNVQTLAGIKQASELMAQVGQNVNEVSAALLPMFRSTTRVMDQLYPLTVQATGIATHANNISGDVDHEVHKFVYPPPRKWWQKFITDPLNDLRKMFEFTHPIP